MSENTSGGAQTTTSGAQGSDPKNQTTEVNANANASGSTSTASGATGDASKNDKRVIDDMHRYKTDWKSEKSRADDLQAKIDSDAEQQMKSNEQYKELSELQQTKIDDLGVKNTELKDSLYKTKKYDAVINEARKRGIREEAVADLELLDLDTVDVELTDHGRMIVHGAEQFVELQKTKRPHWFTSDKAPLVNSGGGVNGASTVIVHDAKSLAKLRKDDPAAYKIAAIEYNKRTQNHAIGRIQ